MLLGASVTASSKSIQERTISPSFTSDGNTLYVGGSGSGNYSHIQDAIDNSSYGDTVFVYSNLSPYYEHLVITKSIDLIGENRNSTIIDGSGTGNIVYLKSNWVNISDFTIQNGGWSGIHMEEDSHNIITKNIIREIDQFCIFMNQESKYNTISHNIIHSYGRAGITCAVGSNYNIIHHNLVTNCNDGGITIASSANIVINHNIFQNNSRGIYASGKNIQIISNKIDSNEHVGIVLFNQGRGNIISYNNFMNNPIHAINNKDCFSFDSSKWRKNYWDDWSETRFYKIPGHTIFKLFFYQIEFTLRRISFDFSPAEKPYVIPTEELL